ncbi:MAG: flagellar protein FlaG [Desulfohalobiaceae bacterium]|nr:flagellar protein FlaG [Desulfohalobiaceae bacterium]
MEITSVSSLKHLDQVQKQSGHKAEQISRQREQQENMAVARDAKEDEKQVAREEILDKIKEISEEGTYSVRFEKDEQLQELIVKIVDKKTDELIRQVPPEEILGLKKYLSDLRGNLTDSAN